MFRQLHRKFIQLLRVTRRQTPCDGTMEQFAVASEQCGIRRVLHQRVLELICCLLILHATHELDHFELYQQCFDARHYFCQLQRLLLRVPFLVRCQHLLQHLDLEFSANDRGDLQNAFGIFGQPINACNEHTL